MRLESIHTNADKYQFRESAFSERTVEAIVSEGIDPAKFDPIPIVKDGGRWVVAGDGHSRLEACRRLAADDRLPRSWRRAGAWEIPTREVRAADALRLAHSANLSRDQFKPLEEARIFKARVDEGESIESIARASHRSETHVRRTLALLDLCHDMQQAIDVGEGGINLMTAQILASGFNELKIGKDQQRDLWHRVIRDGRLNPALARRFIKLIERRMKDVPTETDMMFDLPVNAAAILSEAKAQFLALRNAKQGIAKLLEAEECGALVEIPDLSAWVKSHGAKVRDRIQARLDDEGAVLTGYSTR
jgi:hypothetical protein